jgi:hypothetical protein
VRREALTAVQRWGGGGLGAHWGIEISVRAVRGRGGGVGQGTCRGGGFGCKRRWRGRGRVSGWIEKMEWKLGVKGHERQTTTQ